MIKTSQCRVVEPPPACNEDEANTPRPSRDPLWAKMVLGLGFLLTALWKRVDPVGHRQGHKTRPLNIPRPSWSPGTEFQKHRQARAAFSIRRRPLAARDRDPVREIAPRREPRNPRFPVNGRSDH